MRYGLPSHASRKHQHGLVAVEFTFIATLFFILLFATIEFGRLYFSWHVMNETSRRAARLAAVCQVTTTEQADAISRAVMNNVNVAGFTSGNLNIRYLDSNGNAVTGDLTQESIYDQIEFVEATINNFTINLMIPFINFGPISSQNFRTVLPRESLGVHRTGFTDC
ncbi:TadE/TadG family type IV pilus assembly protein [Thaumasiovibrio sp. DFM-14]|uniref:TadE/TadG family type IV pilus assembly protein n=1 Tax=Thaumasiovibrio sp. DFM-14 TaxID=3384792 RepID=UPI0039A197B1